MTVDEAKMELSQYKFYIKGSAHIIKFSDAAERTILTIEDKIKTLRQPFQDVLYYRYIACRKPAEIGKLMSYSSPRIYQLLGQAIGYYSRLE